MIRTARLQQWLLPSLALALVACKPPPPPPPAPGGGERPPAALAREAEREKEARDAAVEAYVYGYPLVSAELARRVSTNVERPIGAQAPMGQLARAPSSLAPGGPAPRGTLDTLSAEAWIDVSAEPWVLTLPESHGRFHTLVLRSAWNEPLDAVGGKVAKGRAVRVAVTGRGWTGKLPAGVHEVKSPTALVRLQGRVLAAGGPADRTEAQAWLDRITLLPLGAHPKKYLPPLGRPDASLDVKTSIRDQVHALDAVIYFKLLATLLKANPPAPGDAAILPTLARIGLVPGKDYDPSGLDTSAIKALASVPGEAQGKIMAAAKPAAAVNGWTVASAAARPPGYLGRAAEVAAGADLALEGVELTAGVDGGGKPLDGGVPRALRFARGKGPPAEVWTLTAYDARGAPVNGKGGRGSQLTSRQKFQYGRDGTLELLVQASAPRGHEANWLQVPEGPYTLVLRLHGARERGPNPLDGSWKPPALGKPR